jgi:hypothetical protein
VRFCIWLKIAGESREVARHIVSDGRARIEAAPFEFGVRHDQTKAASIELTAPQQ